MCVWGGGVLCVRENRTEQKGKGGDGKGGKGKDSQYTVIAKGGPLEVKWGERGRGSCYNHTATELVA